MDEAYTGSIIADSQADAGNGGRGSARDETEALFADLLKDENEGLAVKFYLFAPISYLSLVLLLKCQ